MLFIMREVCVIMPLPLASDRERGDSEAGTGLLLRRRFGWSTGGACLGPVAAAALIVIEAELIADLSTTLAATELATFAEAPVEVDADVAIIERAAAEVTDNSFGVRARVEQHKAKATGRLGVAVKAHDDALHGGNSAEKSVHLLFACHIGEVAHVDGGGLLQRLQVLLVRAVKLLVNVRAFRLCAQHRPRAQTPSSAPAARQLQRTELP